MLRLVAFFGADRLYLGQPLLAFLKFITFGGFGLWALFDFVVVAINVFNKRQDSPFGGPPVRWGGPGDLNMAVYLFAFAILLDVIMNLFYFFYFQNEVVETIETEG